MLGVDLDTATTPRFMRSSAAGACCSSTARCFFADGATERAVPDARELGLSERLLRDAALTKLRWSDSAHVTVIKCLPNSRAE